MPTKKLRKPKLRKIKLRKTKHKLKKYVGGRNTGSFIYLPIPPQTNITKLIDEPIEILVNKYTNLLAEYDTISHPYYPNRKMRNGKML